MDAGSHLAWVDAAGAFVSDDPVSPLWFDLNGDYWFVDATTGLPGPNVILPGLYSTANCGGQIVGVGPTGSDPVNPKAAAYVAPREVFGVTPPSGPPLLFVRQDTAAVGTIAFVAESAEGAATTCYANDSSGPGIPLSGLTPLGQPPEVFLPPLRLEFVPN
jgi:hypothetical protein